MTEEPVADHNFDNGFCSDCGAPEPAVLNGDIYEISNAGQMFWFAQKVNGGDTTVKGKLTADIDLAAKAWTPISAYAGTFDGNGYAIKNLHILSDTENTALFATTGAGAAIQNLTVIGSIYTSKKFAGGIVGRAKGDISIINCVTAVEINFWPGGDATMGGLLGGLEHQTEIKTETATITNCAVLGSFTSDNTDMPNLEGVGGFVGWNDGKAVNVSNSYVAARLEDNITKGDNFVRNCASLINCYYLNKIAASAQGVQKTTEQFMSGEVAYLLKNGWGQNVEGEAINRENYPIHGSATVYKDGYRYTNILSEYKGQGTGTAEAPYIITSAAEYISFADAVSNGNTTACAALANNIEFTDEIHPTIGSVLVPYRGEFSGNGNKILNISNMLFGTTENADISGIAAESGSYSVNPYDADSTGSIIGRMNGGTLRGSYSKASITNGTGDVGGLTGVSSGEISNCYFAGSIYSARCAGGISGSTIDGLTIKSCYVNGPVACGNANYLGGFTGWLAAGAEVEHSYINTGVCTAPNATNGKPVTADNGKDNAAFASGEVAFLLGDAWGQNLDNGATKQYYPVLGGARVYTDGVSYSNTRLAVEILSFTTAEGAVIASPKNKTASVYFAAYKGNQLAGIEVKAEAALTEGENIVKTELNVNGADIVKVMVWDDMSPLCKQYEYKIS